MAGCADYGSDLVGFDRRGLLFDRIPLPRGDVGEYECADKLKLL